MLSLLSYLHIRAVGSGLATSAFASNVVKVSGGKFTPRMQRVMPVVSQALIKISPKPKNNQEILNKLSK